MIDIHSLFVDVDWGIMPTLFSVGGINIQAHAFFTFLGLAVGIIIYYFEAKKHKAISENTFYLLIAALIGGVIGAKIPILFIYYKEIIASFPDPSILLYGKTITGGLIGGFLGGLIIKKIVGIKERR